MKVRDEQLWLQQLSEFKADEMSRKFSQFLVFWTDATETMMAESKGELTPYTALSKAFEVAEQTFGYLSVEWLGQMLLVIGQHWFHGDDLWESLSVWERRMVDQATALKIAEMQKIAAEDALEPADTPTA